MPVPLIPILLILWHGDPIPLDLQIYQPDYARDEIVLIQPYEPEEQHNESNQRTSEDPEIDERWWNQ